MWIEREAHWKNEYDRQVSKYLDIDRSYLVANQLALGFDTSRLKTYEKRLVAKMQRVIIHDLKWRNALIELQEQYLKASRAISEYTDIYPTAFATEATDPSSQLRKLVNEQRTADNAIRNHIISKGFTNQDIAVFLPDQYNGMREIALASQFIGMPIHIPRHDHNFAIIDGDAKHLYALRDSSYDEGIAATEYKSHELGLSNERDNYASDYLFLRIPRHITVKELVSEINAADNARMSKLLGVSENTRAYKIVPTFPILVCVEELTHEGLSDTEIAQVVSDKYIEPMSYGDINQRYKRSIQSLKRTK